MTMTSRAGRRVYLDYNATAPLRPAVAEAMASFLDAEASSYGNPSSVHWAGRAARKALEAARAQVAVGVGCKPKEVTFTSGATEANNLALLGVLLHPQTRAKRLLVSAVEHPSVLAAAERAASMGIGVHRIGVDPQGRLELADLDRALTIETGLVSVMAVNNETGVILPTAEVIERAHAAGALVHVDAVQAAGRVDLPLGADLISLSGHKLGGPKGVGALIVREHVPLAPQVVGGPQERGLRAGTEPLQSIVGLAVALDCTLKDRSHEAHRLAILRDRLESHALRLPGVEAVGAHGARVFNTSTLVFQGCRGDALLQSLDLEGIAASTGSACSSGSLEPSPVLLAMGLSEEQAMAAIRFSLGFASREEDIDRTIEVLPTLLERARAAR